MNHHSGHTGEVTSPWKVDESKARNYSPREGGEKWFSTLDRSAISSKVEKLMTIREGARKLCCLYLPRSIFYWPPQLREKGFDMMGYIFYVIFFQLSSFKWTSNGGRKLLLWKGYLIKIEIEK